METPISSYWDIALDSWIVQDGNYHDFSVGQTAEFALTFWTLEGSNPPPSSDSVSARKLGGCRYRTIAEVVLKTTKVTVLDIGLWVYQQTSIAGPFSQESRLAVDLDIGVDPYFYFEELSKIPEVPPLIYSWKVRSILRQTAPYVDAVAGEGFTTGRPTRMRDPQRLGYENILRTDAWNDDGGYAEYLLRCELLPVAPKRISARAL